MVPHTEGKKEAKKGVAKGADDGGGQRSEGGAGRQEANGGDDGGERQDAKGGKAKHKSRGADRVRKKPHRKPKYMRPKKKTKTQTGPLNLNNEVVKMRHEVKRVRVLIFRKMMRQITALKKKKGSEAQIEKHQRRAERLLVEIQAMKVLVPDVVTKTALQKVFDFERVCKNPKSTMTDRAIARIATHPQFKKKIDDIKAAVKAFKEERLREAKKGDEAQNPDETVASSSPASESKMAPLLEAEDNNMSESEVSTDEEEEEDGDEGLAKDTTVSKSDEEPEETPQPAPAAVEEKKASGKNTVKPAKARQSRVKDVEKQKTQTPPIKVKPAVDPKPQSPQSQEEEESDIESSGDEEKEYFDDSTEERFRKQSSQSEETDSDNDFFVGKVNKFKKKKKKKESVEEEGGTAKTTDQVESQLEELESRLKSKSGPLRSVFCTSLSGSKPGGGGGRGAGRGRGRGDSKFRGRGKPWGSNRDFGRPSKFQAQDKRTAGSSGGEHGEPSPEVTRPGMAAASAGRGRGRGRGRGDFAMQKHPRGGGGFSQQATQQVLHPSWEASKKRKEQQGQILAFQGKKIKFDDD